MSHLRPLAAPLLIAMSIAAAGCASSSSKSSSTSRTNPPVTTTESGFLRDYSGLRPSPRHPTTRYQQSASLSSYSKFIVDPVQVLPGETARGEPLDGAQAHDLSESLQREISSALELKGRLATAPGPGVGRIRAGITSVATSDRSNPNRPKIGGASIEAEILDSVTNRRIAAAVEADLVNDEELAGGPPDPFYDARLVFRHWASRLNRWIDDADELATE